MIARVRNIFRSGSWRAALSRLRWFPAAPEAGSAPAPVPNSQGLFRVIAGGTLNYGLGSTLPLLIGFLLLPVYTAFLTPEDYGIVEMVAVIGALLTVFMRLGVPGAVTRYYYEHSEGPELRDYVTSVAWFLRVSAFIVGMLALVTGHFFLDTLIPGLPLFPYVVLGVVACILATNSELQRRLIQVRRQSSYSARLSVANSLVAIALTIFFVVGLRLGALGMILAQVITAAVFLANATTYLWPDLKGRVHPDILRGSLRYGQGIFAAHLVASAGPLVSRSLLAGSASLGAVGLFAIAVRVTSPLMILGRAFATAYTPEYFSARKDGTPEAHKALAGVENAIWTLAVLGTLAAALLGPSVIILLTPIRFHEAASLVPILSLGFLGQVLYALASPEMFYTKARWLPPIVSVSGIGTVIALTLLLVEPYGAHGVAWATVAGSAVGAMVCGLLAARHAPVPHDWGSLCKAPIVGGASVAVGLAFAPESPLPALAFGLAILLLNGAILFTIGDPMMRRVAAELRSRLVAHTKAGT